jgi:hypothetical protein
MSSPHRSASRDSWSSKGLQSPSPPSLTYHRSILPQSVPTPALVESVAGAAHYSGVRVDPDTLNRRHSSHDRRASHTQVKVDHDRAMADLKELYACKPTLEIFERSWSKDAVLEVVCTNSWVVMSLPDCDISGSVVPLQRLPRVCSSGKYLVKLL